MKKTKIFSLAFTLAFAVSCAAISSAPASADDDTDSRPVNILGAKGDWAHNAVRGESGFEGSELVITPIDAVGSAWTGGSLGQGKISFTYQLEYAEGVDPFTPEDTQYQCFFGVLFSNSPASVTVPNGSLAIPWDAAGGYPYMLAFDSETQGGEADRCKQLGLTLRRYQAVGSHDFTRWSSVEPTEATYVNSSGQSYQSKIPEFYRPVTMADCFDTAEHRAEIEIRNLYKASDGKDAVKIDVTFDGPWGGEELGDPIGVDKRDTDGYIAWFAYNGFNSNDLSMWDYKVHVKAMTVTYAEGGVRPPVTSETDSTSGKGGKKGCGGSLAGMSAAVVSVAAAAFAVGKRKKK